MYIYLLNSQVNQTLYAVSQSLYRDLDVKVM